MEEAVFRLKLLASAVAVLLGLTLAGGAGWVLHRLRIRTMRIAERVAGLTGICGLLTGALAYGWGLWVEPEWIELTHHVVVSERLPPGSRFRVVHLTDLHVDRESAALAELPGVVNALALDLVVYTGDSLNAEEGLPIFRRVLGAMKAKHGVVAVRGNHDVWYWADHDLFGGVAHESAGSEPLRVGPVAVCGAPYDVTGLLADCLRKAGETPTLVAYHTPDLVEDLAALEPLLYLAGHTHGGQVRLPFYGAIVTMSRFDKKYEAGRYTVGATTLYVNRGIGFERDAPRVRFLCRPEVAIIDLESASSASEALRKSRPPPAPARLGR